MSITAALIGAGASLLGNVIGSKSASRNTKRSISSNEQMARENRDWQDKNYLQSLNAQLGSDNVDSAESVYGGKGSDLLGRDRDLEYTGKNIDQAFDKLSARGLTPQEIAGSPVPGGAKVSGGNNVLGNAVTSGSSAKAHANTAITSQLINSKTQLATAKIGAQSRITAEAIKAGVNLTGQEVSASTARYVSELSSKTGKFNTAQTTAATRDAAQIHAGASRYSTDIKRQNVLSQLTVTQKLNDQQIAKMSAQIALIKQDTAVKAVLHDERWQKLFSTMSADNVIASALAVRHGINIKEVLKGTASAKDPAILDFIQYANGMKSHVRTESLGISSYISDYFGRVIDAIKNAMNDVSQ